MLIKVIAFILCLFSFTNGISQIKIQLKSKKFQLDSVEFYITKIIDGRKNKDDIGYVRNWSDKKKYIILDPSIEKAIQNFVDISLPHSSNSTPIILKIAYLNVKTERISISENTARTEIKLEFYKESYPSINKIFEIEYYEDYRFDDFSNIEVLSIYERQICSVLEHCINTFSKEYLDNKKLSPFSNREKLLEPAKIEKLTINKDNPLLKWINILSFKIIRSKHTEGWRASYIGFTENKKTIFPFIWSFDRYRLKRESLIKSDYKSANYFTPGFGTTFYYKIISRIYANISLQIPVGVEILRDNNDVSTNNFLVGVTSYQELIFIPKSDFGLVFGAGIYQKAHTSKIYKTDFGVEFSVGIKF